MNKILFITAFPPNNQTAGQNYTRQLLEDISLNNEVDLIYFDYVGHTADIPNTVTLLKKIVNSSTMKFLGCLMLPLIFPLFSLRFNLKVLNYIKEISPLYNIIYFDFSQVFIYSIFIKHPNKIFMSHDIIGQKMKRKKMSFLYIWMVYFSEFITLKSSTRRLCFSQKDQALLKNMYGLSSNAVSFYINKSILNIDTLNLSTEDYYIFLAAWNRAENSDGLFWFIDKVLPYVSYAKFKIVGSGMSKAFKARLSQYSNIDVIGFVEDPYILIAKSQALIAPLFNGAGVKVKVIESLATGTPVIGTPVAFEGVNFLPYEKRESILLAKSDREFITCIKKFRNITPEEKQGIKEAFLSTYLKNKFSDLIN